MSDMADAIMDAAEHRIRLGGFGGFSFRELAADVGVKSSSVHYHFPTKERLVATVVRRYTDRVSEQIDKALAASLDPVKAWTAAFRWTLHSTELMCPATVLGAARHDLPAEVGVAVNHFFEMCLRKMRASGLADEKAAALLATITGALVVSTALDDRDYYDRATADLLRTSRRKRGDSASGSSNAAASAKSRQTSLR